jgi:hypothetical protein
LFVGVLFSSALLAASMTRADDDLQGRLLQRSDGAQFIYKDGFKYAIQSVGLSDDLINAIPDGSPASLDQLFAAAPTAPAQAPSGTAPPPPAPAAAPPASAPPPSGLVPVGSGISVSVPAGYSVASATSGQVDLDKNNVTDIRIRVTPPQPSTGPILSSVQSEIAGSGAVFVWKDVVDLPPAGKATQVSAAPFVTSRLQGNSIQNFHGTLLAIARPDVAVTLFFITRSTSDENAAVEAMLASLEQ